MAVKENKESGYRSDPALVQACLDGDARAWETLVDRYGRLVRSIPLRYGLSATDADDVFQNVFAVLVRRLGDLRDQTRLSSWLITTTQRECWRLGRQDGRFAPLDETAVDAGAPPLDEVTRAEREQLVREALDRLDERCRSLLTDLFLAPAAPSYDEIAVRHGMKVGSIGPTRGRCFKKLEAILREMNVEPEP